MFEKDHDIHGNAVKYILVGALLTISMVALGWGVWIYTYQQNVTVSEVPVMEEEEDADTPMSPERQQDMTDRLQSVSDDESPEEKVTEDNMNSMLERLQQLSEEDELNAQ